MKQEKLQEAQNPSTPPRRLEQLATASESEVRAAVAKNPNTPQPALFQLWRELPGAFLENPLVPLLSLENANFLQKASGKMFMGLLSLESCPPWIFERALDHPSAGIQRLAAEHPKIPRDLLDDLVRSSHYSGDAKRGVAKNPGISAEHCGLLAKYPDNEVQKNIARNRNTPAETLYLLSNSQDRATLEQLAQNPNCPGELLRILAARGLRHQVIQNEGASRELILELVGSAQEPLMLAAHPDLFEERLHALPLDELRKVSYRLSMHPKTPAALLEKLADQPSSEHFFGAPSLSARGALLAWRFYAERWRQSSGTHRNHMRHIATRVSKRAALKISGDLSASASLLQEISQVSEPILRCAVAGHPNTSAEVLWALSQDRDEGVRCAVARHPGATAEMLARLAADPSGRAKARVAGHPKAPEELLSRLALDGSLGVRIAVCKNPKTPDEVRSALLLDEQVRRSLLGSGEF